MKMRSIQKYWAPGLELRLLPFRVLGVRRRVRRVRADVAEAAGHAHPVGPDQVLVVVIAWVVVVALRIPGGFGRLVEVRVREQPQAEDAGGVAVVGADRECLLPRAPILTPGYFFSLSNGSGVQSVAHVEPETETVLARPARLLETGLVDQAEAFPAIVAVLLQARVVGDRLEQVHVAELSRESTSQSRSLPAVQMIQLFRPRTTAFRAPRARCRGRRDPARP